MTSESARYEIQWLVPAENSFSKCPYWSTVEDGRTRNDAAVWEMLATARRCDPDSRWRLVRVIHEVVGTDAEQ